jgi:hypothetical protein
MAKSEADIIRGYMTQQGNLPPMNYSVHLGDGVPVGNFNDQAAAARGGAPATPPAPNGEAGMSWLAAFSPDSALATQAQFLATAATQGAAATAMRKSGLETAGRAVNASYAAATQKADIEEGNDSAAYSIAARGGFDVSDPNNAFAKAMGVKAEVDSAYAVARAEYDAASQIDFFSDPLGFIQAQMGLPALSAKVNNLAAASDRAEADFKSAAVMTKTAQEMNMTNSVAAVRQQKIEAANAVKLQAEAQIQALGGQALQQEASLNLQLGNAAGSMLNADITRAQRTMVNRAKEEQAAEDAQRAANLDSYNRRTGRNESVATLKNMTKAQQDEIMTIGSTGKMGIQQMIDHAGKAALENRLPPDAQGAYNTAVAIDAEVARRSQVVIPGGPPAGTQKAYDYAMDLYIREEIARVANTDKKSRGLADPKDDNSPAPYRADFKTLKTAVAVAAAGGTKPPVDPRNYMFRMLMEMDKAGKYGNNGKMQGEYETATVQFIATAAAKGSITDPATGKVMGPVDAARVISDYYSQMIAWQNKSKQYTSLGLPELRSYPIRVNNGTEDVLVDMASKADVERFMSRRVAYDRVQQQGLPSMFGAFPPLQ